MKKFLLSALGLLTATFLLAQRVEYSVSAETGAISKISLGGDSMSWTLAPDGSQYRWVGENYAWGLGRFRLKMEDGTLKTFAWKTPERTSDDGTNVAYRAGDILISVKRFYKKNDLVEEYTFENVGSKPLQLVDFGINTPFNDNYLNAEICVASRCNAHIWAGGSAAYVNAMRMGGSAPHLGLALTQGAIKSYEVAERSREKGLSNFRGVIMLNPEDITLKPKESYTLAWQIFAHKGWEDFNAKLLECGSVVAKSDKYVYQKGEKALVTFVLNEKLKNPKLFRNGKEIPFFKSVEVVEGNNHIELSYGNGKRTHIEILGVSSYENIAARRAEFILKNQQMRDAADARFGAFMVYDNEDEKIYLNDNPNACCKSDRDEGRERLGMGDFLALYCLRNPNEAIKKALTEYADFIRNKLQNSDYRTFSTVDKKSKNRAYNYPWVASFYLRMFQLTDEPRYLQHAYGTLRAMYRQFGHNFYAIDIPIELSIKILREAKMAAEADTLLADFRKMGDTFAKNGTNYPKSEVNYEQSIVAPSIISLLEIYKVTGEKKYLAAAEQQLPLLEAFAGQQPSYHLNEIAIRHWDGYWFGKREAWGDTFPHYWSILSAVAFDLYAEISGNRSYKERAKNIARNNLCLFTEDGRGSCAYVYPYKVNGEKAQFYDPYANDQDWALYFYLQIFDGK